MGRAMGAMFRCDCESCKNKTPAWQFIEKEEGLYVVNIATSEGWTTDGKGKWFAAGHGEKEKADEQKRCSGNTDGGSHDA